MKMRITEHHYDQIRRATCASFLDGIRFPPETGCIILVGRNDHPTHPSVVVADVLKPEDGELTEQARDGLVFSSRYLRRALLRVRDGNLAGFLTIHTHPMSDTHVNFSPYDDANDPYLMANLYELEPRGVFGSMVLSRSSARARLWNSNGTAYRSVEALIIVGEQLRFLAANGDGCDAEAIAAEIFDRSLAITGKGALAQLARMRVGLIGGSGTGSIMAELLMRAGVGHILIFEPDHIEKINLPRILHSRRHDAEAGVAKSFRLAEAIHEAGLDTQISLVPGGDIRREPVALELRSCDVVIGCVDRDWPRLILCELANQYLIPYIDLGTEIGIRENEIQSLDSRVSYVAPGRPCLLCSGVVTNERIRLEALEPAERDRVLAMGYSDDIRLVAPAVMDLNMRAASYAMLVVRHLLQSFLDTPLPTHIKESLTNYSIRRINHTSRPDCPVCRSAVRLGFADARRLTTVSSKITATS
jgi:molybdopterin/thiamine biosynthesis adenylyltransferase